MYTHYLPELVQVLAADFKLEDPVKNAINIIHSFSMRSLTSQLITPVLIGNRACMLACVLYLLDISPADIRAAGAWRGGNNSSEARK